MNINGRLIVALDADNFEKASELVDTLAPVIEIFKVGIVPFVGFGDRLIEKIHSKEKKTFLDLKFHDIPNTVKNVAGIAAAKNVFMMNFHCAGGSKMLIAAASGAKNAAKDTAEKKTLLLGVTVLTSMENGDMEEVGLKGPVEARVDDLVRLAQKSGLDGVVASAREIRKIKEIAGRDFIVVTPGIRPEWAAKGDQKRVMSPADAIKEGADYIVVGRPIIQAPDPLEAAKKIIQEMKER